MRPCLLFMLFLMAVGSAAAQDLGNQAAPAPAKPTSSIASPPPDPQVLRQGGDTIFSAFPISTCQPQFHDTGTTAGYVNDYDAICPYSSSTSPDVVYSYVAEISVTAIDVDLCYSSFDTKVYVYDSSLNLIACNDDYHFESPCFVYSSKLEHVEVTPGDTYYIVVDGYGGASGDYDLVVSLNTWHCDYFQCPEPNFPEGEPPLQDGYTDVYDGGCQAAPNVAFADLSAAPKADGSLTLCGNTGWYLDDGLQWHRDTDWYILRMGPTGTIEVEAGSLVEIYLFELGPQDCEQVAVLQSALDECPDMTISGYSPGAPVWFWVGPSVFTSPDGSHPWERSYTCWFTGLEPGPIATQATSWSTVKAMFD